MCEKIVIEIVEMLQTGKEIGRNLECENRENKTEIGMTPAKNLARERKIFEILNRDDEELHARNEMQAA